MSLNPSSSSDSHFTTSPLPNLFGRGGQMGLAELLQMSCLSKRSGQITFISEPGTGYVYLQHGQVVHAILDKNEGEEAIYQMLQWPAGTFSIDNSILPHKRTISMTWEQLLFEGARRADGAVDPASVGVTPSAKSLGLKEESPITSSRIQGGQPRVTILSSNAPSQTYEIESEFVHVGRIAGNEIVLPDSAVSSRHCMFIRSGQDVLLRDLNSSNGTFVNGEPVTETVLQLGDVIQVGSVLMKFESSIKRPKLNTQSLPQVELKRQTQALPPMKPTASGSALNKPIIYQDLASPKATEKKTPWLIILLFALVVIGGIVFFFMRK